MRSELMLPNPHDTPALGHEAAIHLSVSHDITLEFGAPEFAIRLRHHRMLRTSVPEASIDEHGDSGAGERHIRTNRTPFAGSDRVVDAVPQSYGEQGAPEQEFRSRVTSTICDHRPPRRLRGRRRCYTRRMRRHGSLRSFNARRPSFRNSVAAHLMSYCHR